MVSTVKKSWLMITALTLVVLVAGWYTYQTVQDEQRQNSDAVRIFGITEATNSNSLYTTLNGSPRDLHTLVGKQKIYLNTWASWSPLSRDELIVLNEVAGSNQDSAIVFIALNRKETREQAERFLATLPPLPHLEFVIDTTDQVYQNAAGYAMPETLLFNINGELVLHERQPLNRDQIEHAIQVLNQYE